MNRALRRTRKHRRPIGLLFLVFGTYFFTLFPRMLQVRPDGLYAGHVNVWSDWSLHIGMARIFALKDPADWFAYHPMYAAGKMTYGFLTNFISGMLMRLGISLYDAFIFPSIIYAFLLIVGLYAVMYWIFRSRAVAVLAVALFFLSSGLGFIPFLRDVVQQQDWARFMHPPEAISTKHELQWYAGNVVVGLLVPQRAFLLGFTVAIWSLFGFLYVIGKRMRQGEQSSTMQWVLLGSGILASILPITHMHSFIALVLLTGLVSSWTVARDPSKIKLLLWYALPAGLLSSLLYFRFISGGIENLDFMRVDLWWSATSFKTWIIMWYELWGAMIPAGILGAILFLSKARARIPSAIVLVGFLGIFVVANIIVFQPINWDNSKLFFWAYLGFSGCAAYLLVELWKRTVLLKVIAVGVFIALTLTGVVELIHFQRTDRNAHRMIGINEMTLAERIIHYTDPRAIFLTEPSHNHWVMMWAARPIVMGYTAWVWNFGFLYQETEAAMREAFFGSPRTPELLRKLNVDYVVIGPGELYSMKANERYFRERFPLAFQTDAVHVYDVRSVKGNN